MADLGTGMNHTTSRRTLVRGAAWSVPVVAVAATAPAYATSLCADGAYQIRWATEYNTSTRLAIANRISTSGSGAVGNAALRCTIKSEFAGEMAAATSNGLTNLGVTTFNLPATNAGRGLSMIQRSDTESYGNGYRAAFPEPRSGHYQRLTLTFNRPVWDLNFTLTDIDSNAGQYQDRIFVSGSPKYTYGNAITGAGSSELPWRPTNTDQNWDHESENPGNVNVDYSDRPPASEFTITYWNDDPGVLVNRNRYTTGNAVQGVFIGTLRFGAETCA